MGWWFDDKASGASVNANGSRGDTSPPETTEEKIDFLYELAVAGVSLAIAYYSTKLVSALVFGSSRNIGYDDTGGYYYDNTASRSKGAKVKARLKNLRLNSYEKMLCQDVVDPDDIQTNFNHVGGLKSVKKKLREMIIYPMKFPEVFIQKSALYSPPRGVLLYGKPGCGKTMLAKCLAKESGAFFINVRVSSICDKWFGESEKKVRALFSLARKLSPCIIFIDEVEAFLKSRAQLSNEPVMDKVKSEFLIEWDGLKTDSKKYENKNRENVDSDRERSKETCKPFSVLVLGATNRPGDVDEAFIRRMPRSFKVSPPDEDARKVIIQNILSQHLDHDQFKQLDLQQIAQKTTHYTGSDLKELCKIACQRPLNEFFEAREVNGDCDMRNFNDKQVRHLEVKDFLESMKDVPGSLYQYATYQQWQNLQDNR